MRVLTNHDYQPPDRYFVALVEVFLPIATSRAWPSMIRDTLLFEQPTQLSYDEILATARKAWTVATRFEVTNFYEMSAADYKAFMGYSNNWTVIDE